MPEQSDAIDADAIDESSRHTLMKSSRSWWIGSLILALLLATFALAPTAGFGLVWQDDSQLLVHPQCQPGWEGAKQAFLEGMFLNPQAYWRPLPLLTYQLTNLLPIERRLYADHLVTIALGLSYVLLAFAAGRGISRVFRPDGSSILPLVCLCISLHASLVEPAAWIAGRFDLLLTLACLLTFVLALSDYRKPSALKLAAIGIVIGAADLCKEIGPLTTASALLAAYSVGALEKLEPAHTNIRCHRWPLQFLVWLTVTTAWAVCYWSVANHSGVADLVKARLPIADQTELALWVFWTYVKVSLLPWLFVSPVHAAPLAPLAGAVAGGFALVVVCVLIVILALKKRWAAVALACAIAGPLIALSALGSSTGIDLEVVATDRYLLSLTPAFLCAAYFGALRLTRVLQQSSGSQDRSRAVRTVTIGLSILALVASVMDHNYAYAWKSHSAFWGYDWIRNADSSMAALSWANDLIGEGGMDQALAVLKERSTQLKRSRSVYADPSLPWNQLLIAGYGEKLTMAGRLDDALAELGYWIDQRPAHLPLLYRTLAISRARHGECTVAQKLSEMAGTGDDASTGFIDVSQQQAQLDAAIAGCFDARGK